MKFESIKYGYKIFNDTIDIPKIEIYIDTYEHDKYISQAIDSILMQRTKYLYHIIIADDCSTDDTIPIILRYQKQFPDKIIVAISKKNTNGRFRADVIKYISKAEYFCNLDGDDYWTDPYKIEKQVSFLDEHPEYIGITGNVRVVNEDGSKQHRDMWKYYFQNTHIYGIENVIKWEQVSHISVLLHRNIFLEWTDEDFEDFYECKANGDIKLSFVLGIKGDIFYSSDIYGDHRRTFEGKSWTAKVNGKASEELIYSMKKSLQEYIQKKYDLHISMKNKNCSIEEQILMNNKLEIEKLRQIMRMYNMILRCREQEVTVGTFLKEKGVNSVAIYGMGILGQSVVSELIKAKIIIEYVIDRNKAIKIPELRMFTSYEKVKCPRTDIMLVTAVTYYDEIKYDLMKNGCVNIVSLDDILYQMTLSIQHNTDKNEINMIGNI